MSKILLSEPKGPYSGTLDTEVLNVTITEVFTGVNFITEDKEELSVLMRDSGYELYYKTPNTTKTVLVDLKGGDIYVNGKRVHITPNGGS